MLYSIAGTIQSTESNGIVIERGGLSFFCIMPNPAHLKKDTTTTIYTHLHWSAEQGPTLFGFQSPEEKKLFLLVIDCPGVGPKLGISILEQITSDSFIQAINTHDATAISKLKGIGAKKAEQMILHLKNKIDQLATMTTGTNSVIATSTWNDLQQTLLSLGYTNSQIIPTIQQLKTSQAGQPATLDILLRKAFSLLANPNL